MSYIINTGVPKNIDKKRKERKRQLQLEREKMLSKHKTRYDNDKKLMPIKREVTHIPRDLPIIPSLNSHIGTTEAKEKKQYTGTKLVGIATMHKSNMVPVFSKDEATEVSRMRRG